MDLPRTDSGTSIDSGYGTYTPRWVPRDSSAARVSVRMFERAASELQELREQVRVLAAGLGLDDTFSIPDDVRRYAASGEKVRAVKALRDQAPGRLSLVAAKRMVDALARA